MRQPIICFGAKILALQDELPTRTFNLQKFEHQQNLNTRRHETIANMADGIDRKAEERMEFTTSKDVTVAPTFQDSMYLAHQSVLRILARGSSCQDHSMNLMIVALRLDLYKKSLEFEN